MNDKNQYVADQGPIDSYNVLSASASYQLSHNFNTYMGIENLLNNDYYPARAQAYAYGGYNVKGLGRTITLGVKYSF